MKTSDLRTKKHINQGVAMRSTKTYDNHKTLIFKLVKICCMYFVQLIFDLNYNVHDHPQETKHLF